MKINHLWTEVSSTIVECPAKGRECVSPAEGREFMRVPGRKTNNVNAFLCSRQKPQKGVNDKTLKI